jgi:hypothetical protein
LQFGHGLLSRRKTRTEKCLLSLVENAG